MKIALSNFNLNIAQSRGQESMAKKFGPNLNIRSSKLAIDSPFSNSVSLAVS